MNNENNAIDALRSLIVEDNLDTQAWLVNCVHSAFPSVRTDTADNVEEALSLLRQNSYGLALIDLGLPDGSGIDVIRALKNKDDSCHIVVATIYDDDKNLFTALKSGAKGYILKDQDKDRIVGYLQGIKHNRPAISAASSARLIEHFNSRGDALEEANLTKREIDVICLIGKGYSVEESAGMLSLSPDTIKGYIKNIYAKLGVKNRSEVTLEAIRLGLIESES
ncbi:MAG: DNA-binding response regulator [Pseudohongiella sp.]|nr:MAG: DNA-binding response regulator [Pseudohongiella sp.]